MIQPRGGLHGPGPLRITAGSLMVTQDRPVPTAIFVKGAEVGGQGLDLVQQDNRPASTGGPIAKTILDNGQQEQEFRQGLFNPRHFGGLKWNSLQVFQPSIVV
jgi:hypothetical protein